MQVIHLISKTGMKTVAGKLWTISLMNAAIGGLVCLGAAHLWRMSKIGGFGPSVLLKDWNEQQLLTTFAWSVLIMTIGGNVLMGVRIKKG